MNRARLPLSAALAGALLGLALAAPAAAQLSEPLVLPGDLGAVPPAGVESEPVVSRGGDRYLVVWQDDRATLTGSVGTNGYGVSKTDLYAMRLDADGNALDAAPILVSSLPFAQENPRVAWNGSAWLVVWEARRPTQFSTTLGVRAARVSAAGEVLDPLPIVVDDRDDVDERFPVVAGDGGRWAILWKDLNQAQTKMVVAGAVVEGSGFVGPHKSFFATDSGFYTPVNLGLAAVPGRYLMTSEHSDPVTGSHVYCQLFDTDLGKIGGEFWVDANGGGSAFVTASDAEFYVVWNGGGLRGTPVTGAGNVVVPGGTLLWSYGQVPDHTPTAGWTGADWLVTYEEWQGAAGGWILHGLEIDGTGAVTNGPFTVSSTGSSVRESIAFGGAGAAGEAVVLWGDDRLEFVDLWRARVSPGGVVGPESPLVSAPAQTDPDVSGDEAHGYLVSFLSWASGQNRVVAQRLDPDGVVLDPEPIELAAGPELYSPRVDFDGERWLVVWEDRTPGYTKAIVQARRVELDGTLPDPAPFDVVEGNMPDVAGLDGQFLVVSSEEPTNHVRYIRSQVVDGASGTTVGSRRTPGSTSYARFPKAARFADRWVVTWQRNTTHDSPYSSAWAAFVDAGGDPGAQFVLESVAGDSVTPAFAASGDVGMFVFPLESALHARRIQLDGTWLDGPGGVVICTAPNAQFAPEVGWVGDGFVATWTDYRIHPPLEAGLGDVYAARLGADGSLEDGDGLPVATDYFLPEGDSSVAGDGGRAFLVYADLLPEAPWGTYRVVVRRLEPTAVGSSYCGPANLNSSGASGEIRGYGSAVALENDLELVATQLPTNQFGYFLVSATQGFVANPGGSQGNLCLAGEIGRYAKQVLNTGPQGTFSMPVDLTALPTSPPSAVQAGETWSFQSWFRDNNPGPTSNFTDGLAVSFL